MEQPASLPPLIPRVLATFSFLSQTQCVKGIPHFRASGNMQGSIILRARRRSSAGGGRFTYSSNIFFDRLTATFVLNKSCSCNSPVKGSPLKVNIHRNVQASFVLFLAEGWISIPLTFISLFCFIWSGNYDGLNSE